MSNSSQFGGSFLCYNNPELACLFLFPAAISSRNSPFFFLFFPSARGEGLVWGGSRLYNPGLGRLFWIPPSCLQIAAPNVTSYKTLESFLSLSLSVERVAFFPHKGLGWFKGK